jgi:hypothetical protein
LLAKFDGCGKMETSPYSACLQGNLRHKTSEQFRQPEPLPFLAIWKEADADIPILKEAKAEYARLK